MGKTSKWLRRILLGKKEKGRVNLLSPTPIENPASPIAITPNTTPKDRKRWSFRRSPATTTGTPVETTKESKPRVAIPATPQPVVQTTIECENDQQKHVIAMTSATAAVMEEPITAAKQGSSEIEEAAAIRIQSYFRSFLARKALRALKGLVKLQALVRGHLVRKQATATLRCMQALVSLQARARAQRTRMAVEETSPISQRQFAHRKSLEDNRYRQTYNEMDRSPDENVKIVEMDLGELRTPSNPRSCYSNQIQAERTLDHRFSSYYPEPRANSKQDNYSPAPSTLTDMSPRVRSGHFEEYPFDITDSSPHYYSAMSKPNVAKVPFGYSRPEYAESISSDYPFFPNYMANTESSKAKVRSQSAPKQRPETAERPPSRRRISTEGRNIPRAVRMQRSISHVGPAAQGYNNHPWSVKPDQSAMSVKDSECGSTSTVLTNTNYCKSLVAYEPHGSRF